MEFISFLERSGLTPQWAVVGISVIVLACLVYWFLWEENVPTIKVDYLDVIKEDGPGLKDHYIYVPKSGPHPQDRVQCYNPANFQYYGFVPALKPEEVQQHVKQARAAQIEWAKNYKKDRRRLLKVILKYILSHQDDICRVSARDSGKVMVDAAFGEILTTCEKIHWLLKEGDKWLQPEYRSAGAMLMHKVARVEYQPLGVLGAIVPWNYPFHNVLNPMLSAVFAGNAIVIKVSEHASWSTKFYGKIVAAALAAVGAPKHLVHIISGYAETGQALVNSGIDKLTFVGSTEVGKKVMMSAAQTLTPLVLELGGKDPFIVCDDADLSQVVPIALRGAYQCSGQNCVGAERFYIQSTIHDKFVEKVLKAVKQMNMGDPIGEGRVDIGAICMPRHPERLQELVDDAVAKGATIAAGGRIPTEIGGHFYPPTVLLGVDHSMQIMQEEAFGPIMPIMQFTDDDHAVRLANDSAFGLGAAVFAGNRRRANRIVSRLRCGMASINDFGATYMCQSLPFGGVKHSGFDKFGGIEGLRGCCNAKAVAEDRFWFLKTHIPKPLQYPVSQEGFALVEAMCRFFYTPSVVGKARGLVDMLKILVLPERKKAQRTSAADDDLRGGVHNPYGSDSTRTKET